MDKKYQSVENAIRNAITQQDYAGEQLDEMGVIGTDKFKGNPPAFNKTARVEPNKSKKYVTSVSGQRRTAKQEASPTIHGSVAEESEGTKIRTKMPEVGRPDSPLPTDKKTTLNRQMQIQKKIIDESILTAMKKVLGGASKAPVATKSTATATKAAQTPKTSAVVRGTKQAISQTKTAAKLGAALGAGVLAGNFIMGANKPVDLYPDQDRGPSPTLHKPPAGTVDKRQGPDFAKDFVPTAAKGPQFRDYGVYSKPEKESGGKEKKKKISEEVKSVLKGEDKKREKNKVEKESGGKNSIVQFNPDLKRAIDEDSMLDKAGRFLSDPRTVLRRKLGIQEPQTPEEKRKDEIARLTLKGVAQNKMIQTVMPGISSVADVASSDTETEPTPSLTTKQKEPQKTPSSSNTVQPKESDPVKPPKPLGLNLPYKSESGGKDSKSVLIKAFKTRNK